LPAATVSAMLNGTRKTAPKLNLQTTFVMACEWYAWNNGIGQEWATHQVGSAGATVQLERGTPSVTHRRICSAACSATGFPAGRVTRSLSANMSKTRPR
jgi:hypothetical protein